MKHVDVFNGDADGICALHQLRLAEPRDSELVTGVKRDIDLLKRVEAGRDDRVTVLDISLDKNRDALVRLLGQGAKVLYFDHHFPGDVPEHANLDATIDTAAAVCTSLLVDDRLWGRYRLWAIAAAFGDNLEDVARAKANDAELSEPQQAQLRELGIYINYNAYGATPEDLHFAPDDLYRRLRPYEDPFDFIANDHTFASLERGYAEDMAKTVALEPEIATDSHALYVLPCESWARRVSGVLGNQLAQSAPERAHALLTRLAGGGYLVSVRAPLSDRRDADTLCRQFPTGGGRKAAAGINHLPEQMRGEFAASFAKIYG